LIASGRLTATGNNPFSIDTNGENLTVFNGTQITNAFPVIGTSGFTKNGAGTMELTVANTYAGVTTINGGELKITAANQIGNAALATNTIAVGGFGTSTLTTNGTFALGTNRSVSLSANAILNVESGNLTVDGNVTGSGGLIKTGFGTTLILTGSNSYGTTEINDGTVQVGNGGTTGSLGTGAVNNVGTLVFKRSNTLTVSSNITGTIGTVTNDGGATNVLNLNGSQDYLTLNTNAGTTNVNATIASLATVNANAGSKLNFSTNQTLMALNIGAGATVTMNAVAPFSEFSGPSTAAVPEPGSLGLLVVGALGMLARRRRRS
jgi:autotransporter-associated beta strand protein